MGWRSACEGATYVAAVLAAQIPGRAGDKLLAGIVSKVFPLFADPGSMPVTGAAKAGDIIAQPPVVKPTSEEAVHEATHTVSDVAVKIASKECGDSADGDWMPSALLVTSPAEVSMAERQTPMPLLNEKGSGDTADGSRMLSALPLTSPAVVSTADSGLPVLQLNDGDGTVMPAKSTSQDTVTGADEISTGRLGDDAINGRQISPALLSTSLSGIDAINLTESTTTALPPAAGPTVKTAVALTEGDPPKTMAGGEPLHAAMEGLRHLRDTNTVKDMDDRVGGSLPATPHAGKSWTAKLLGWAMDVGDRVGGSLLAAFHAGKGWAAKLLGWAWDVGDRISAHARENGWDHKLWRIGKKLLLLTVDRTCRVIIKDKKFFFQVYNVVRSEVI